jgi:hypothetical protein
MLEQTNAKNDYSGLFLIGGIAAMMAAILFRRNMGAEVSLFVPSPYPTSVIEWFQLLQASPLVALSYLKIFDVVNACLLIVVFLALYLKISTLHPGIAVLAFGLRIIGLGLSITQNTALSMISLSNQFVAATSEVQRSSLIAAGQAILAIHGQTGDIYQNTGVYVGYVFLALSGILFSCLMMQHSGFGKVIGMIGLTACSLDFIYCLGIVLAANDARQWLGLATQPLAGLLLMVWHFIIGLILIRDRTAS